MGPWLGIPPNSGEFSKGFFVSQNATQKWGSFSGKICTVLASQLPLFPYNMELVGEKLINPMVELYPKNKDSRRFLVG